MQSDDGIYQISLYLSGATCKSLKMQCNELVYVRLIMYKKMQYKRLDETFPNYNRSPTFLLL